MSWPRIFWMIVGGLVLLTLVTGCGAPGDHNLPDGYYGPFDYANDEVKHVPPIGK